MSSRKINNIVKILILSITMLLLLQPPLYAHSGRTDSSGGHKDNKNASGLGSYHYHCGGHPPHLHSGGVCPYSSSSTKSSSSSSKKSSSSSKTSTSSKSTTSSSNSSKNTTPKNIEATSVKIQIPSKAELQPGEEMSVSALITPSNSTNKTITWESSNSAIATISEKGEIKAISDGTVTIKAKSNNGLEDSISLTIKTPKIEVDKINLNIEEVSINVGDKKTIKATVSPENATNKKVTWSSSDNDIATVKNGTITAIAKGNAEIIAEAENGIKAVCKVTVLESIKYDSTNNVDVSTKNSGKVSSGDNGANIAIYTGLGGIVGAGVATFTVLKYKKKK